MLSVLDADGGLPRIESQAGIRRLFLINSTQHGSSSMP